MSDEPIDDPANDDPVADRSRAAAYAGTVGDWWAGIDRREQVTLLGIAAFAVAVALAVLGGVLNVSYLLFLLGLGGMFTLMTLGLNVQWGYTGLVNFSVVAFWGIGAYSAALLTADLSPLTEEPLPVVGVQLQPLHPLWGLVVAVVVSAVLATLIAVPTLRLRADYLAIATLGFAEIVRMVINNERDWTRGSAGIAGIPQAFEGVPEVVTFDVGVPVWIPLPRALVETAVIAVAVLLVYAFLRRIQLSPWGRIQRTIRADEDLAQALGKNTFRFKLQSFVLGSVIMAVAGVVYVHLLINFVNPNALNPIRTFYVWIGVILGGTGSNRGAVLGGLTVVAVREAPSFIKDELGAVPGLAPYVAALNEGAIQLFLVGALVIVIVRYRSSGLLPPKREYIWPAALDDREGSE